MYVLNKVRDCLQEGVSWDGSSFVPPNDWRRPWASLIDSMRSHGLPCGEHGCLTVSESSKQRIFILGIEKLENSRASWNLHLHNLLGEMMPCLFPLWSSSQTCTPEARTASGGLLASPGKSLPCGQPSFANMPNAPAGMWRDSGCLSLS